MLHSGRCVRAVRLVAQLCCIAVGVSKCELFVLLQVISLLFLREELKITELARRCQVAGMCCVALA